MQRDRKDSNDYRAKITKQLIHRAYLHLFQEDPQKAIPIAGLCREAGINRGTFYLHYEQMSDLTTEIEDVVFERFKNHTDQTIRGNRTRLDISTMFYSSLINETSDYPALFLIAHSKNLEERITNYAKEILVHLCVETGQLSEHEAEIWAIHKIGGILALIRFYYEKDRLEQFLEDNSFIDKVMQYGDSILDLDRLGEAMGQSE